MTRAKTWEINPTSAITFEAALKSEDIPQEIQDEIAKAVQQTVIAKLQEHGLLEHGAPVAFSSDTKNQIIKPPTK
jgi:hypothetical protein